MSLDLLLACGLLAAAPASLTVEGERFTPRQIVDPRQHGMVAVAFMAPEKWKDTSQVSWNYADINSPVTVRLQVENPANAEAYYLHPPAKYFALRPDGGLWKEGSDHGGWIKLRKQPPLPTLVAHVRKLRPGLADLRFVGSKDLPDLPKALETQAGPNQTGQAVKVTYTLKGQPVEEEFYAVYYWVDIPYDGPQGRSWQTNWGLVSVHSFRAPAGTLERRRPVFAAIGKSARPNPAWVARGKEILKALSAQWQRNMKAGYDQIAAAGALSKQISAQNDAFIANIDRQMATSRAADSAQRTETRTGNDRFDDYLRGVVTVDDPTWGTSQQSANQSYHWTDGYGSYRHSNDVTYDPNQHESGSWQLMPETR